MPVDEAPDDDDNSVRESYNFAPGYHGLVYRADGPDHGGSKTSGEKDRADTLEQQPKTNKVDTTPAVPAEGHNDTKYKLQAMRWGESCITG